jgi:succinyl-diaminopimelate desuccinylase
MDDILRYLDEHQAAAEEDLKALLRIPSVSADPQYHPDCRRAADWVAGQFREMGLATEVIPTVGQPLVYAESTPAPGKPVALVYGHYDVQPPDPLAEWITPPFEPTVRNGNVYARGATDDKGQMLTHVQSVKAWLKTRGQLPMQVKFLIEGEEESGGAGINEFFGRATTPDKLQCDCVVVSDTSQFAPGQPAITYGLRGIAYFELRLTGPKQDLHSGTFGGAVTNPLNALCVMLTALRDSQGRVQVPGFYDDVLPLTEKERQQFAALPFTDEAFQKQLNVEGLFGEAGYSTLERRWARPTYDLHGIWGGYQGEGGKTVLPAKAGAKFSFRLVPNQDPHKIAVALEAFLKERCPPGIRMELIDMHGAPGVVVPLDNPCMTAAAKAIERGFGKPPVFIREGGSIPIVTDFTKRLNAPVLLLGWGLDDDNTHSPNEKFCLADYHRGIRASACLWEELATI